MYRIIISAKYWHYTGYISNEMLTLAKHINFTLEIFLIKRRYCRNDGFILQVFAMERQYNPNIGFADLVLAIYSVLMNAILSRHIVNIDFLPGQKPVSVANNIIFLFSFKKFMKLRLWPGSAKVVL